VALAGCGPIGLLPRESKDVIAAGATARARRLQRGPPPLRQSLPAIGPRIWQLTGCPALQRHRQHIDLPAGSL